MTVLLRGRTVSGDNIGIGSASGRERTIAGAFPPAETSRGPDNQQVGVTTMLRENVARDLSVRVSRSAAGAFLIRVPVVNAPTLGTVAEWGLKQPAGVTTWSLQGCSGIHPGGTVILSDTSGVSVYEGVWWVSADSGTAAGIGDYVGGGHGHETLLTRALTLDGADITGLAVGGVAYGSEAVSYQTMNMRNPKTAAGAVDDVTICGARAMRHTFNSAGVRVRYTVAMQPVFINVTCYAANMPLSNVNFDRVQLGAGGTIYTPVYDDVPKGNGTQVASARAWHTTAHHFQSVMTLPSGGPDVNGDWQYAGPEKMWFFDRSAPADYVKVQTDYQGSTYANRRNTGTTDHEFVLTVEWV